MGFIKKALDNSAIKDRDLGKAVMLGKTDNKSRVLIQDGYIAAINKTKFRD